MFLFVHFRINFSNQSRIFLALSARENPFAMSDGHGRDESAPFERRNLNRASACNIQSVILLGKMKPQFYLEFGGEVLFNLKA